MFPQARSMIDSQQKAWHGGSGTWNQLRTRAPLIKGWSWRSRSVAESEKNFGGAQATCPPSLLSISALNFPFQPHDCSRWFFWSPSHIIRTSTKALIACLAKSGGGPPEVDEELSFGRNLFGHNFFTNFLGGPLGSGTFPTFGWGCSSFPQRVVVGLPSGASRCLLVGIAFGWGFIGLEDCFFPPAVRSIEGCAG